MSTLADKLSQSNTQTNTFRRAFRPTCALAKSVRLDNELMHVALTDGQIIRRTYYLVPIVAGSYGPTAGEI